MVDLPPEFPGQRPRVDIHGALDAVLCGNGVVDSDETCDWAIPGAAGCCSDECVAVEDGSECSDDVFCTLGDVCEGGICVPGESTPCPFNPAVCALVVCVEDSQECASSPVVLNVPCDDGLFCTVNENCQTGNCSGSSRDCSFLDGEGVIGVCSEEDDACVTETIVSDPGPGSDAGSDADSSPSDATEDVAFDAAEDSGSQEDISLDVVEVEDSSLDVSADVTEDVAPDVAEDVAPDVTEDVAEDVAPDVVEDVAEDVAPDVVADAIADGVETEPVEFMGPLNREPGSCGCSLLADRSPGPSSLLLCMLGIGLWACVRGRRGHEKWA